MKEKDNIDRLFNSLNNSWDVNEPPAGHKERFNKRLGNSKKHKSYLIALPVAAVLAVVAGLVFLLYPMSQAPEEAQNPVEISPQVQETQDYFATIISKELKNIEKQSTPETQILVKDALRRLDILEKDYNRLMQELSQNGESKQLINAMITNLQTRISFLEEVQKKIENIKKLKQQYNENSES